MANITAENTREFQAKGMKSRRIYKTERARLVEAVNTLQTRIEEICAVVDRAGTVDPVVHAQLKQVDRAISAETDPALLVRLVQAKATLYSLIHPKPGIARPRKARSSLDLPPPSPVQPSPVQPVKPEPSQPNQTVPGTAGSS